MALRDDPHASLEPFGLSPDASENPDWPQASHLSESLMPSRALSSSSWTSTRPLLALCADHDLPPHPPSGSVPAACGFLLSCLEARSSQLDSKSDAIDWGLINCYILRIGKRQSGVGLRRHLNAMAIAKSLGHVSLNWRVSP